MFFVKQGSAHAGLPPLNGGAILGFILGFVIMHGI
jgi:presenilin-like A22 family membrane protease